MEENEHEELVTKVALVMCRRFYWGKHVAKDREVRGCAEEIMNLIADRLEEMLQVAFQKPHGARREVEKENKG